MKRKAKRILGSCGLFVVGLITTFAAFLPTPDAAAVSSVTDVIQLRVVADRPEVTISGIRDGEIFTTPQRYFQVNYSGADTLEITIEYTGGGRMRSMHVNTLEPVDVDYETGDRTYRINLRDLVDDDDDEFKFGYGNYIIRAVGIGYNGASDVYSVAFSYIPTAGTIEERDDGTYYAALDYDYDNGSGESEDRVAKVVITIYDEQGNQVGEPIEVTDGSQNVDLPFEEIATNGGTYTIEVASYDRDDNLLYTPLYLEVEDVVIPNTGVPDTGFFTSKLNISRTDYLITGMIIFGITVVASIRFVAKGNKKKR